MRYTAEIGGDDFPYRDGSGLKFASGVVGPGSLRLLPVGRLIAEGVLLRFFIQNSYGLLLQQISGGPAWIDSDRFDIEAKLKATPHMARWKE